MVVVDISHRLFWKFTWNQNLDLGKLQLAPPKVPDILGNDGFGAIRSDSSRRVSGMIFRGTNRIPSLWLGDTETSLPFREQDEISFLHLGGEKTGRNHGGPSGGGRSEAFLGLRD